MISEWKNMIQAVSGVLSLDSLDSLVIFFLYLSFKQRHPTNLIYTTSVLREVQLARFFFSECIDCLQNSCSSEKCSQLGKWSVPLAFSRGCKKKKRYENYLFSFLHSKRLIVKSKSQQNGQKKTYRTVTQHITELCSQKAKCEIWSVPFAPRREVRKRSGCWKKRRDIWKLTLGYKT